ncbi:hypothetical protein ABZ250_24815 [Streptomyces afghaniensis]|uniref:hypothetical protein n=1 Tax=Streptomyces afghaniensis TaxID=66865 RepID=UPI0033B0ADEB
MSDLIERGGIPEGDKVEVFDGRVIMTPQSPEQVRKAVTLMTEPRDTGLWEERRYSVRPSGGLHSRHE